MINYQELLAVASDEALKEQIQASDLVFIGAVVSMGKPPVGWSGFGNTYQAVNYKIDRILKGSYHEPEISILHVLVFGSLTAQEGEQSALSPELFAIKSKLIVSAQKTDKGQWKSLFENYGALPATQEWIRKIESALR